VKPAAFKLFHFSHFHRTFTITLLIAKFDYLRGEIAVVKIAAKTNLVNKAKFIFEAWKKPPPTDDSIKIQKDMNQLLLDVAVRIDHDIKEQKNSVF